MRHWRILVGCLLLVLTACRGNSNTSVKTSIQSVYIQNKGSDTIVNLALAWAERYQAEHPEVSISVTGGGSGTGIAALINNTVDIANASRQMTKEEIDQAIKNGIVPEENIIARDAIAVVVNPENPVSQLTLQQISDIYSGKINNWSQVGGENRPIVRLSRESNSGTHVYFLATVIRLGNSKDKTLFSEDTLLLPSSEGIIAELRDNPNAIGYDGLGYITSEVKVVAVAKDFQSSYVLPSMATVNDKTYPIARDLYMYTNKGPSQAVQDYLKWVKGEEAQAIVKELGFVPILGSHDTQAP